MLRLPVTYTQSLICFASRVHAAFLCSCLAAVCAPGRPKGAFQAGVIVQPATRLPVYFHVDVSGISQVSRRSILCLCLGLGPRPNQRSLAYCRSRRCCPRFADSEGFSVSVISGLNSAASAPTAYASRMVLPPPLQSSLPAGWLAFTGRESNPLDRFERFQITFSSPFPGLLLALPR